MAHIPGNPRAGHEEDFDISEVTIEETNQSEFSDFSLDEVTLGNGLDPVPTEQKPWYQPIYNFVEGLNYTLASAAQIPFDIGRAGHQLIHPHDPDNPVAGVNAIHDLFEWANLTSGEPKGYAGQMGEEAAWNLGSAVPVFAAARATKFTYSFFEPLVQFVRSRPLTSVLIDLGLSIPMGAGAEFGEKHWGETGKQLGRLGGSTVLAAPYLGYALGRGAFNKIKGMKGLGFTEENRQDIAGDVLANAMTLEQRAALTGEDVRAPSGSPSLAERVRAFFATEKPVGPEGELLARAGSYADPPVEGGPFTTGEILDAGGLTRLRQGLIARSEAGLGDEQLRIQSRQDALLAELDALRGDPTQNEAAIYLANRIRNALALVDSSSTKAIANAQVRIDRSIPNQSPEVASKIARDELDKAFKIAQGEEDRIWKLIGTGRFNTDAVVNKARAIIAEVPRLSGPGGEPDIPPILLEIAGTEAVTGQGGKVVQQEVRGILHRVESIKEIAALSSRLNRLIRKAYNDGEPNLARLMGKLRDSLYDDIIPVDRLGTEPTPNVQGLAEARAFSRLINDKFNSGPVGRVRDTDTRGALKVDPELTLNNIVTKGQAGRVATQRLLQAYQQTAVGGGDMPHSTLPKNTEAMDVQIKSHLTNLFAVATDGKKGFDIGAAHRFVRDYPVLDLYPDLKEQMMDARRAAELIERVSLAATNRTTSIKSQSVASRVTGSDVPIKVNALFKSTNPVKDANQLMRTAAHDPTGEATSGVRNAFFDHMVDKMVKPVGERDVLHAGSAVNFINNKTNRSIVKVIYGEDGLRLLDAVMKGMQYQMRGKPVGTLKGDEVTGRSLGAEFAGNLGTVMGARLLGRIVGHPLLAAGIGRRRMGALFDKITKAPQDEIMVILQRALDDPDFAKLLLIPARRFTEAQVMNLYQYAVFKDMMNVGTQMGGNFVQ